MIWNTSPHRTLTGICNDLVNPLMGATGMPFGRSMQFEVTCPWMGESVLTRNRHGGRIDLLTPDPQLISRKLFARDQAEEFDSEAQFAFARGLRMNPWHCLPGHRPLGNQNRVRRRMYDWFSRFRLEMNRTTHVEPTGDEVFE